MLRYPITLGVPAAGKNSPKQHQRMSLLAFGVVAVTSGASLAQRVLQAHALPWTAGYSASVALFFDLEALRDPVVVEGFTTALNMGPGQPFTLQVWTRDGTSLGGTATSGSGYSTVGWTSLGFVQGEQGPLGGGISLPVSIPRFLVRPGHITGVALDFYTGGPATYGDLMYYAYADDAIRLTTGDVRTPSFTLGQSYFPRQPLIGSIIYDFAGCYANCDSSTIPPVLNVNDFVCFLGKFANGDSYANCDGSTTPPVLNVNDFLCFTTQFAAGCS
jgi:hypothetical protein